MKVVLQRVRVDPLWGKFAQRQQAFPLASAEIPDPNPENARKRC